MQPGQATAPGGWRRDGSHGDERSSSAVRPPRAPTRGVRATTERLASALSAEDQTVQTMPDVSPTKWHRAHSRGSSRRSSSASTPRGYRAFDDAYAYIFNSYYEAVGARHPRPERGLLSRPGIDESPATARQSTRRWTRLLRRARPARPGRADHAGPPP